MTEKAPEFYFQYPSWYEERNPAEQYSLAYAIFSRAVIRMGNRVGRAPAERKEKLFERYEEEGADCIAEELENARGWARMVREYREQNIDVKAFAFEFFTLNKALYARRFWGK